MFCKYCGSSIDDSAVFCSKCGKKLTDSGNTDNKNIRIKPIKKENNIGILPVEEDVYSKDYIAGNARKKSALPIMIAVIVICFAIGGGIGAYFVIRQTSDSNDSVVENTDENSMEAILEDVLPDQTGSSDESVDAQNEDTSAGAPDSTTQTAAADSFLRSSEPSSANNTQVNDPQMSSPSMDGALDSNISAGSEYILPDSNMRLYTENELMSYTAEELRIARNEIYARYGRKFKDPDLQRYFDSKSWYRGQYDWEEFDKFGNDLLSDVEKKNTEIIKKVEDLKS